MLNSLTAFSSLTRFDSFFEDHSAHFWFLATLCQRNFPLPVNCFLHPCLGSARVQNLPEVPALSEYSQLSPLLTAQSPFGQ